MDFDALHPRCCTIVLSISPSFCNACPRFAMRANGEFHEVNGVHAPAPLCVNAVPAVECACWRLAALLTCSCFLLLVLLAHTSGNTGILRVPTPIQEPSVIDASQLIVLIPLSMVSKYLAEPLKRGHPRGVMQQRFLFGALLHLLAIATALRRGRCLFWVRREVRQGGRWRALLL
jgi:hypothetical protein